jgi:peptidoglycan/LPS O-acetylase OafA/YrhL
MSILPPWLQNEGAWIALGVSLFFVIVGWVMHRVVVKVLKAPAHDAPHASPSTPNKNSVHHE